MATAFAEPDRVWEQALEAIRSRLDSQQAFETWFRPITPLQLEPPLVELEVPNPFFVDWIHEHYLPLLTRALEDTLGAPVEIRLRAAAAPAHESHTAPRTTHAEAASPRGGLAPSSTPGTASPRSLGPRATLSELPGSQRSTDRSWLESQLHPRLTFENFIVGTSSAFTHAACRAVAEKPGEAYNPLFIFAGSGLGKTHLLHAIGHAVKQSRPEARVYYVPAERFTNEMIFAIQHAQTLAFRNKYRNVDVLLIDDIQFLAGKESTQEEFFYTFNALRDAHKQIVVTADKPPKDLSMVEERLTSRFNQGLVCDIMRPDIETRLAILRHRYESDGDGLALPDDAFLLIADRIRNNVRDLEGCLVRVLALGSLLQQEITMPMVEKVLEDYVGAEPDRLSPERVVAAVSDTFGVRPEVLLSRRRTASIALPRQVAMYLMRQLTDLSLGEIGRTIGGRDHSTVMYACDRVGERIATDGGFSEKVNGIISTLSLG
ncbi:MAG: chromosomal replication initiator protein DnaA [Candidatus Eisenbacteria bacterium]|uniref:Chromosomal replication initiator protein DnaA n=1 Tax=Eiseniibacteriota bacterium TaxID=2212470 RepID=A0A849STH8_UNCEI|nr:chromosomal replication initiator protein DnaA [Candidatus Eisenbacteria bacterium]